MRIVFGGVSLSPPQSCVYRIFDLEVVGYPALLMIKMGMNEILLMH